MSHLRRLESGLIIVQRYVSATLNMSLEERPSFSSKTRVSKMIVVIIEAYVENSDDNAGISTGAVQPPRRPKVKP
ncbi:hypothetical protein Tco_1545824 [Tanacetum coccineum]